MTLSVQPDGKILVAGVIGGYNGTTREVSLFVSTVTAVWTTTFNPSYFENLTVSFIFDICFSRTARFWLEDILTVVVHLGMLIRLNSDGGLDSGFQPV